MAGVGAAGRAWQAAGVRAVLPLLSARLRAATADPADLLVRVLGDLLVAGLGLVFLWAVFSPVPDVRGWTRAEALLVWGLAEAASGLAQAAFHGLWTQNQRYVMTGDLDRLMLRPVDPLLALLAEQVMPGHLTLALGGGAMMALAAADLPPLPPAIWLGLLGAVLGGAAIQGGVMLAVAAVGLRVPHRGRTVGLASQAAAFARYPLDVFPGWLAWILVTIVPMGLVAAVPGAAALGRLPAWALAAPALAGAALLAVGVATWRRALRGYASTGS